MHEDTAVTATAPTSTSSQRRPRPVLQQPLPGASGSHALPPLPLPPKSPKRYASTSASSQASSSQPSRQATRSGLNSDLSSTATSPMASYFDALSSPARSPGEEIPPDGYPSVSSSQANGFNADNGDDRPGVSTWLPPPASSSSTRVVTSTATTGASLSNANSTKPSMTDEELALRKHQYSRSVDRTSALPVPSPEIGHSQRRRRHQRSQSSLSRGSGSRASVSSIAESSNAGDSDASYNDISRPQSAVSVSSDAQRDYLPASSSYRSRFHGPDRRGSATSPPSTAAPLDGEQAYTSRMSAKSTSPQHRNRHHAPPHAQHQHHTHHLTVRRDSQASGTTTGASRARTSQATSYGPFAYDADSTADLSDTESSSRLKRDFLQSLERTTSNKSTTYNESSSSRLSIPITAYSLDTLGARRTSATHSSRSPSRHEPDRDSLDGSTVYRGSQYLTADGQASKSGHHFDISPASSPRSHTEKHLPDMALTPGRVVHREHPARPTGRTTHTSDAQEGEHKRTPSHDGDLDVNLDDLKTPRVSVSARGRMADSMYSTAGTAPDLYPHSFTQTIKNSEVPPVPHSQAHLGLGLPPATLTSAANSRRGSSLLEEVQEALDGPMSRFSLYSDSNVSSSNQSPTDFGSTDQESIAPTPVSKDFRNSMHSFSSASLSLGPPTPALEQSHLTDEQKKQRRRTKLINEMIQTEEDFARDMLLVCDVWLARARGKEMGDILATLALRDENKEANGNRRSRAVSFGGSSVVGMEASATPRPENAQIERKASAPQMARNTSQGSFKSLKGLMTLKSGRPSVERQESTDRAESGGIRAVSHSGFASIARATSNQPLPPGAALYAPMRQADVDVVFGNIQDVANFSRDFASILREQSVGENPEGNIGSHLAVGKAFNEMIPRLSQVYSTYCSHFGDAITRWELVAGSLAGYCRDCKDLCYGYTNAWDLPSQLIKPVQRCLKYPLFLQGLLECTDEGDEDKIDLVLSHKAMLAVAESINELKRRQEIVGKLIKRKPQYNLKSSTRSNDRPSSRSGRGPSGGSLASAFGKKFRRSSRLPVSDKLTTLSPPEEDPDFDALLIQLEQKHKVIHAFIVDSKAWSKSVRSMMVSLLQLSVMWKNVSILNGLDDRPNAVRSSRTIDHFAMNLVKGNLEEQWRDLDQDIRKSIIPKAVQLLDHFHAPRTVISKRYHSYNECHSKAASKDYAILQDYAAAYNALNAQLKEELPQFLRAVDKYFTALCQRLISLQSAFLQRTSEDWLDYIRQCCSQLGEPDQEVADSVKQWWKVHKPLVQRFDSMHILAIDKLVEDVERRQRNTLPPNLRPRTYSNRTSASSNTRHSAASQRSSRDGGERSHGSELWQHPVPPVPRRSAQEDSHVDPRNRNSAFSATSAGSLTFSGQSSSSVTSPPTPASEYPTLWTAAVSQSYRPSDYKPASRGYDYLACEPGDLFDILDAVPGEKHILVRSEGPKGVIGWLPAHLLHKLE